MITYEKHTIYVIGDDGQATAEVFHSHISHPDAPGMDIPEAPGNRHYDQMIAEVAAGDAEIIEVDDTVLPDYAAIRRRMYAKEGIPTEELVVALWERIVEGRTADEAGITGLQTRRVVVKNTHPKPE